MLYLSLEPAKVIQRPVTSVANRIGDDIHCSGIAHDLYVSAVFLLKLMHSTSTTNRIVKSWFGFFFALTISGLNTYLWLATQDQRYMLVGIGFLFWAYPWSQKSPPISKFFARESASHKPLAKTLTTMGWGLHITSVIAPLIP